MMQIIFVLLAIALFFITNWIGRHSFSIGYLQLSVIYEKDTAPALNFIYRALSPVVYIILVAVVMYSLGFDDNINNLYLISIYYFIIRILFNVLLNRYRLLNWPQFIFIIILSVAASYYVDKKIIIEKTNIIPDFSTMANELWVIILIYLYTVFNKIEISSVKTEKRKNSYIKRRLSAFIQKFGHIVQTIEKPELIPLFYAIMIYEDFNRPKAIRLFENLSFFVSKKEHTLGIMQVQAKEFINDSDSVSEAVKIFNKLCVIDYENLQEPYTDKKENELYTMEQNILKSYNIKSSYPYEIRELKKEIHDLIAKDII